MIHVDEIWPVDAPPPPSSAREALSCDGAWSPAAAGVEIRQCVDNPRKGLGAFAVRLLPARSVLGVYWGEKLTLREFNLRHGWNECSGGERVVATPAELQVLAERRARLESLGMGKPIDGEENGGSYCFSVLPTGVDLHEVSEGRVAFIDAEDPNRSSWLRYINHASGGSDGCCNATSHVNAAEQLIWFTAQRDILPGEEISLNYYDTEVCETPSDDGSRITTAGEGVAETAIPWWQTFMSIARKCLAGHR